MPDLPFEVSPTEIKTRINAGEALRMIDVREIPEHQICRIEGARLIPMNSIPQHLQELESETSDRLGGDADNQGGTLIVFCHHGVRSLAVVDWLRRQGLENCQSMAGGIDLWSLTVDDSVPRY